MSALAVQRAEIKTGGRRKGTKKTGGRQKGARNKVTINLKEMILRALDEAGGYKYFLKQSEINPVAFMAMLSKVLPLQIHGANNVLLIEQLCVAANAAWQREKALANGGQTIEASADSVELEAEPEPRKVH